MLFVTSRGLSMLPRLALTPWCWDMAHPSTRLELFWFLVCIRGARCEFKPAIKPKPGLGLLGTSLSVHCVWTWPYGC